MNEKVFRALRHLKDAVALVWQSSRNWTVAGILILFVQGLLPLVSLYLLKLTIDTVSAAIRSPADAPALFQTMTLVLLLGAVNLAAAFLSSLAAIVSEHQSQKTSDHVYDLIQAKSIEIDLEHYESPEYHDTYYRAQQEAPFRPTQIVRGLAQFGQAGISLAAVSALLLTFHWLIAAALILAVLPGIVVRIRYANRMHRLQNRQARHERRAHYLHWVLTGDLHAKEVRLFNFGDIFRSRFRNLRRRVRRERLDIARQRAIAETAFGAVSTLAIYGSLAVVTSWVLRGGLTIGDLVMYYQGLHRCQGYLREMLSALAGLYENTLFLSRFHSLMELTPAISCPSRPRPVPSAGDIRFEAVRFAYQRTDRTVLDDLHMTIRDGEHVALVGENGSGKTTLVKLLCRLYDPQKGIVRIDGADIRELDPAALRKGISIIFQDYARYHLTARENIWIGDVEASPSGERVSEAARMSGVRDMIRTLPRGLDTHLGKWFKDGEELSVGEWQKIALARGYMRDARIIVLDEPTSALDPAAEHGVLNRFKEMTRGKTALFISHRLSTARLADRIFVMKSGRIVEEGGHDALMAKNGFYARLFDCQARYYR